MELPQGNDLRDKLDTIKNDLETLLEEYLDPISNFIISSNKLF